MKASPPAVWLCFAVPDESRFLHGWTRSHPQFEVIHTGIGAANVRRTLNPRLSNPPSAIVNAGFAGGLNPALPRGQILFDVSSFPHWHPALTAAGARPSRFTSSPRIAITPAEKAALHAATQADAVDMESAAIGELCASLNLPFANVRIISDAADESLPLDFNTLFTPDYRFRLGKLAASLALNPALTWRLIRFQRQTSAAARALARFLESTLATAGFSRA